MKHRLIVEFATEDAMREFVDSMQLDSDEELIGIAEGMAKELEGQNADKPVHRQIHAYPADILDFLGHPVPGTDKISWYILRSKDDRADRGGQTAEGVE